MLKDGTVINGYEILERLNIGGFAIAYKARKSGKTVFLKQYRSPKPSISWYSGYVNYQDELKRRISDTPLKSKVLTIVEFFESTSPPRHNPITKQYYQVFDWIQNGGSLEDKFEKSSDIPMQTRLTWAKVLMSGIVELHKQKIVHSDLKPANVVLIEDKTISVGYHLKLIDMDLSILADRKAPWDGHQGYAGTPGYMSPEHLRGDMPLMASDIFTCGIMLSELLAREYPYKATDMDVQNKMVQDGKFTPVKVDSEIDIHDQLTKLIHRMLSPTATNRPTADEVHKVLLPAKFGKNPPPPPPPPPLPLPLPPNGPLTLSLDGHEITANISFTANRNWVKHQLKVGDDARFWDIDKQFEFRRTSSGWELVPNVSAANDTVINDKKVTSPTRLKLGDRVGVGRAEKRIYKTMISIKQV
jgi:serine/threonine protein kinase